jgi:serine/threonine-protein kinase SRPK3
MVALLGPPSEVLLADSGPRALKFFNEDGTAKGDVSLNDLMLESVLASSLEQRTKGTMTDEELKVFLAFIRRTLTCIDEKRASAEELLDDPLLLQ